LGGFKPSELFRELSDQVTPWDPNRQLKFLLGVGLLNNQNNTPKMCMCIFNRNLVMNAALVSAFGGHKFSVC